jgi:hypothetical protein
VPPPPHTHPTCTSLYACVTVFFQYCYYCFRLLDRIVLIHVPNRSTTTHDVSHPNLWNQRFSRIIAHVSSAVGNIIQIGQWLHTSDGTTLLGDCLRITKEVFGYSARRSRLAECWSCVLFAARKVYVNFITVGWNVFLCACTRTIYAYI